MKVEKLFTKMLIADMCISFGYLYSLIIGGVIIALHENSNIDIRENLLYQKLYIMGNWVLSKDRFLNRK